MRTIISIIFVSLTLSTGATIRQQAIDSVIIKYASWSIITDIAIDCVSFEKNFDYKLVANSDLNTIFQLFNELDRLKIAQNGGEDIRCKLEFYHSGNILLSCCLGSIITKIGPTCYYTTSSLKAVVDSIVENSPSRDKLKIDTWDPCLSIQKISDYLSSQSDRLYKNVTLYEDLSFIVFCNVGEGGKTLCTRFTKNQNGKDKDIPLHIVSIIQDILANEITWDVPPKFLPQWIPVNISIKSNAKSKGKIGDGSE